MYGQKDVKLDSLISSFSNTLNDTLKAECANDIANRYYYNSNYQKSIEYNLKAFSLFETLNNNSGKGNSYSQIGVVYYRMENWEKSVEYFKKALEIAIKAKNFEDQGRFLNNLGNVYEKQGNYSEALAYHQKSLIIKQEFGDSLSISKSLSNIGNMYYHKQEYAKAISYYKKSMNIKLKTKDNIGLSNVLQNIGFTYLKLKDYSNALSFVKEGLNIANKEKISYYQLSAYSKLSDIYYEIKNYKEAHHYLSLHNNLKDSLDKINNAKLIAEMDAKFEAEKKDNEIALQQLEIEKKNTEVQLQSTQKIWFAIGLFLALVLLFVAIRGIKQKQKTNQLLEIKNNLIEEKNKEITDSITYAKRIQEAILPPSSLLNKYLKDGFVFYKPKDIVAGDFYWMHVLKNDTILFAVADCTGHGVPGAMVSVICHHSLNRAVREYSLTDPGLILDKTREFVIDTFAQNNEFNVRDGMDIALCAINYKKKTLQFSGANNPLYILSNNEQTIKSLPKKHRVECEYGILLHEIKGTKQPIGSYNTELKPFVTHNFELNNGDIIYLFTDGYADQFGGDKNKKLKYGPFKKLLMLNSKINMDNQQVALSNFFNEWKGNMDQVDDVCVMGIKIT
ncbi:MAG: tetratricopeptide repeat protein [Flavobacteriales bacterium]|nr:tetratricopeptide repeat protein [Flavobacteriales bacterium]MCB9365152.1 tetratricopeptide repeat protein [Flavobacteriales bacterium]